MPTSLLGITGSLAYDYLSQYDGAFEEALLPDQLNALSVCFVVSKKERHFGGTAGNIAYSLALLGERPLVFAAAGNDFHDYGKRLKSMGVDLSPVRITPGLPCASATIITDRNGHQITEFYPGAMGAGLTPHTDRFPEVTLLHIAPDDPRRMLDYISLAQHLKIPYFFDPGQILPAFTQEQLLNAMSNAEGVFVNEYEWALLKRKTELAESELAKLPKFLVITRGEEGSAVHSRESDPLKIPIAPPLKLVNPTGCGDAYRAGFLKGYAEGMPLEVCARMGALLATYVLEDVGTQNHEFTWKKFAKRFEKSFGEKLVDL